VVLIFGDVISTVPAYFLNGWASVAVTLIFIIFSTVVDTTPLGRSGSFMARLQKAAIDMPEIRTVTKMKAPIAGSDQGLASRHLVPSRTQRGG
jgi:hypothetical protein